MYRFLVLLLLVSCSQAELSNKSSKEVDQFITRWNEDYDQLDKEKELELRKYLVSVENFYIEHHQERKFTNFLSSINNNEQIIAHLRNNLPARFKKHYGSWPVRKSPNYLRYEKEQTQELSEKLEDNHMKRMKADLGSDLFKQLKDHLASLNNPL